MKDTINKLRKWFFDNGKNVLGLLVIVVIVIALTYAAMAKEEANANLRNNVKQISDEVRGKTESIKLLTEERFLLREEIKKIKVRKMQEEDNIKNYILTYYKTVAPAIAEEIATHILEKSAAHNVPFVSVVATMEVESHFNPFAISKKGARGLMQVMPRIWVSELKLSNKYALHDIEIGIDSGVRILRRYLDATDNNMRQALYKYVGGDHSYINNVYKSMGKFIVFKSFTDIKVSEEEDVNIVDNDAAEAKTVKKVINTVTSVFTHTVVEGQTFGLIAKWYTGNVNNWPKISKANPTIIPNKMPIGSVVIIPTNLLKNTTPLR